MDLVADPSFKPGHGVIDLPAICVTGRYSGRFFPGSATGVADLIRGLIEGVRSGRVDGWVRTPGLPCWKRCSCPKKGTSRTCSTAYKLRMLEAFKALMTKRRETHSLRRSGPFGPHARAPPAASRPGSGRALSELLPPDGTRLCVPRRLPRIGSGRRRPDVLHGLREGGRQPPGPPTLSWRRCATCSTGSHLLEDIGMPSTHDVRDLRSGMAKMVEPTRSIPASSVPIYVDKGGASTQPRSVTDAARALRIRPKNAQESGWQAVEYRLESCRCRQPRRDHAPDSCAVCDVQKIERRQTVTSTAGCGRWAGARWRIVIPVSPLGLLVVIAAVSIHGTDETPGGDLVADRRCADAPGHDPAAPGASPS